MLFGVLFMLISSAVHWKVNEILPEPFIDEIFHVPQTQQYCNGTFAKWDDKITTPPALYIFALLLNYPLKLFSFGSFCSVAMLRSVNVLFNTVNLYLLTQIVKEIHTTKKEKNDDEEFRGSLQGVAIAFFPVNYFFSFLFYTDPGSVTFVLSAYLACLRLQYKLSAFFGLISLTFRQTNIVWILFCAGHVAVKEMMQAKHIQDIETSSEIKDKLARFMVSIIAAAIRYLLIIGNLMKIVKLIWPYLCAIGLFAGFIFINGGIALGDKQNHEATFHGVQVLYFFAFSLFFASPYLVSISYLKRFLLALRKNPMKFLVFALLFGALISKYTYIHKFLLADNRHYTFYLCRYFLSHPVLRMAGLPLYVYAAWAMNESLEKPKCTGIWKLLLLVCVMMVTIPQKLIELRYFILPYIIFRVNMPVQHTFQIMLELLVYTVVNIVTLYLFFTKEIIWPNLDQIQRLIW